ncbi:alpha-ribazole phosphatase [Opitutaceae bacterium EW11]|nr:alpha-ribazole phosphatase [Opitutaceae bacterium EW11]
MKAVLVRHTHIEGNAGLCYGRCDLPLAKTFDAEAHAVALKLPFVPETIWSSPASRCVRLAERLGKGRKVSTDPRLAELHFGEWEGRPWEELRGPAVDAWMNDPWRARPPGGETVPEMLERVRAFRDHLLDRPEKHVVLVTHAGVIRAWRSLAEKRPLAELFDLKIGYGEVVEAR